MAESAVRNLTTRQLCGDTDKSHDMTANREHQRFVQLLTAEQLSLQRYLLTILGDFDAASTALQETNLVLLRKWEEFEFETSFAAWSRRVAYWQALALLRDNRRDKLVFSEELVRQLAQRSEKESEVSEERLALRHCLSELDEDSLLLIRQRYGANLSIKSLAERLGKTQSAIKVSLHRIRRGLMACIKHQLASGNRH